MRFCVMLLTCLWINYTSFAQVKKPIKKSYAFITEHTMGNIPVDENGKELLPQTYTTIKLFVEITDLKNIKWDTVWYNQNAFKAEVFEIKQKEIKAGVFKGTGEPAVIKISKGSKLVQINLTPMDVPAKTNSRNSKLSNDNIVITGKNKGIAFLHNAGIPAQLEAIPSM